MIKTEAVKLMGDIEKSYIVDQKYIDRFWSKVDIKSKDDCWEWKSSVGEYGYGSYYDGRRTIRGHRFSFYITHGFSYPKKVFICHNCDNPKCVNPNHLFAGTQQDNVDDRQNKNRSKMYTITHCKHGHEFTKENTIVAKNNYRSCKICLNKRMETKLGRSVLKKNTEIKTVKTRMSQENYDKITELGLKNKVTHSEMIRRIIHDFLNK